MSQLLELQIDRVAHGGHCVARHEGRVVFVRHCLPGERVLAKVTSEGRKGRFLNADAVEILEAAAGRVTPPCELSGPDGCGGCDWQHADSKTQRELKTAVVAEQMKRFADVEWRGAVQAVPGDKDGLAWRTRVRYTVDGEGRVGFRKYHSHDVVQVDRCPIASERVQEATCSDQLVVETTWQTRSVSVVDPASGPAVVLECADAATEVTEVAVGRNWRVPIDGFWQVHPGAADVLCGLVTEAVGEAGVVWDLYGGVGLFAGAIGFAKDRERIDLVESDRRAVACARKNLAGLSGVRVHRKLVEPWLQQALVMNTTVDCVVLDPPRKGAGRSVLELLHRTSAKRLVYVACDPAALARDTRTLTDLGWTLAALDALDMFPMTHHIESVAVFDR